MAKLRSLNIKSKDFIFTSYGNDKEKQPAKIIFKRFPKLSEMFIPMSKKDMLDGVNLENLSEKETQKKIKMRMIDNFLSNLNAGAVDYKQFFDECVDRFENLEYEQSKIITVNDFWQILPPGAAEVIALEAHNYAQQKDEFTMGE